MWSPVVWVLEGSDSPTTPNSSAYGRGRDRVCACPVPLAGRGQRALARVPVPSGDVVISTRSKSGTTWVQTICALLVFQDPELPAPLVAASPWLDWLGEPRDAVVARLEAQQHRRFVKTHTPLDGAPAGRRGHLRRRRPPPARPGGVALPPGRQPRPGPDRGSPAHRHRHCRHRPRSHAWLRRWIARDADPRDPARLAAGVLCHLSDAWARRERAQRRARPLRRPARRPRGRDAPARRSRRCAVPASLAGAGRRRPLRRHAGPRRRARRPTPAGCSRTARPSSVPAARRGRGREVLSEEEWRRYLTRRRQAGPRFSRRPGPTGSGYNDGHGCMP